MRTKWYVQLLKYFILIIMTFIIAYPIFLMISSSFKSKLEIFTSPLGLPKSYHLKIIKLFGKKLIFQITYGIVSLLVQLLYS